MKYILVLVALVALVSMSTAMPTDMMNDTSVCKIVIDTGSSAIGIFAWHNLASHQWEVVLGTVDYMGRPIVSKVFYGDDENLVPVVLS